MREKINILNIKVDRVDMLETVKIVESYLKKEEYKCRLVMTPNSEMIVKAYKDSSFASILNSADLVVPDGSGLLLASRILSKDNRFPERVAGFDLMQKLLFCANKKGYKVYFLGAKPGIACQAAKNVASKYPDLQIAGFYHGFFEDEKNIIKQINKQSIDLLFVGMGVPYQEEFLHRNRRNLHVKVALTVGGSFDVLAGRVKRAPLWMQKSYLEWFYRLLKQPARLKRMGALPYFLYLVFLESFKKGGRNASK